MTDQLNIANEMRQFDRKNRAWYDELSDEDKKKFSPYLMIRWGSAVEGSRELQEFYVIATNERLNKHFFNINSARHKKLQWLMATTVSPGMGAQRHNWIAPKKKQAGASAKRKQLAEIFPHYRDDELDVMMEVVNQKEIDQYFKSMGRDQ
jgi:hypothetical protein